MVCSNCGCELGAIKFRTVVENDTTPDLPTKVYTEHDMACKNKHCSEYNVVQNTIRNEVNLG